MNCYECANQGSERPAVATCRSCSAGLCLDHLRATAAQLSTGAIQPACEHDTWLARTTPGSPSRHIPSPPAR